jgi:methylsterol monooxygenase/4-alpha-methyl-delta7-sterol-4alpha-methyl oxidase
MYLIYHAENPFFEKFKVNDRPWPWNENREKWNQTLRKTLSLIFFNTCILIPCLTIG